MSEHIEYHTKFVFGKPFEERESRYYRVCGSERVEIPRPRKGEWGQALRLSFEFEGWDFSKKVKK